MLVSYPQAKQSWYSYLVISAALRPARVTTRVCGDPLTSEALESDSPFSGLNAFKKDGILSSSREASQDEVSRNACSMQKLDTVHQNSLILQDFNLPGM